MSFLAHPVVYFVLYILLVIPTYFLPYLGSNSAVGIASVAATRGISPLFVLHFAFLTSLVVLAWMRGAQIRRKWLTVFPGLALVFDLTPGLNWIPIIPTTMHLLAIIIGAVPASQQAGPTEVYVQNRRTNEAPNDETIRGNAASSPLKAITLSNEAGQGAVGDGLADHAKFGSTGKWVKPVGLVGLSLVFLFLLFNVSGVFKTRQPDLGNSQVGASPRPPAANSLTAATVPPLATTPPPRASAPVASVVANAAPPTPAPTPIGKADLSPAPIAPMVTAPAESATLSAAAVDPILANVSPLFRKGLADRISWEQWFSSQTGDFKAGAEFWAGQRNLPRPDTCHQQSEAFRSGCTAAKEKLAAVDVLRKSAPDYKAGWNAFGKPPEANR